MVIEKIINNDKPILALIHSGNSTPDEFKDYVELLKNDFSLWLFTVPGHGKDYESSYEPIRYNAVNFLEELKKENKKCYIFGRGLGAQIAIAMALEDSTFVKKIVVESPLCVSLGLMTFAFRLKAKFYKPNYDAVAQGLCLSKGNYNLMVRDNTSFMLDNRVHECNTSVLVLHAEKDDKALIHSADYICGYFKNSKRVKYPYSHDFGISHFEEVIPAIKEFLLEEKEK